MGNGNVALGKGEGEGGVGGGEKKVLACYTDDIYYKANFSLKFFFI